jgi:hypothetical protein
MEHLLGPMLQMLVRTLWDMLVMVVMAVMVETVEEVYFYMDD